MRRIMEVVCIILLVVLSVSVGACTSKTPGTEESSTPLTSTTASIETPQEGSPPIVRISDNDYSRGNAPSIMQLASDSELSTQSVEWALSNQQVFVGAAVKQANELNLDSENLEEIMTKLVLYVDQLDFQGKNMDESGVACTFKINNKTVQLPYLIEKAKYQGKEAWLVVLNWEMNYDDHKTIGMSHIALIVFEYGSDNVLFAMSCA